MRRAPNVKFEDIIEGGSGKGGRKKGIARSELNHSKDMIRAIDKEEIDEATHALVYT